MLRDAMLEGELGRWLILVNAGDEDGEGEQQTVPAWMCAAPVAERKPDMVVVRGWPYTAGEPAGPVRECMGERVELIIVEFTCTTEQRVADRIRDKAAKYEGLRQQLRDGGWFVAPRVEAIAMGVRGGVSEQTVQTLKRLGIREKRRAQVAAEVQSAVLEGNVKVVKAKRMADGPRVRRR